MSVLARHGVALRAALDRIAGALEWGVKVYCETDALRRRMETESASLRQLRERLAQASPGTAFFLEKKYVKALENKTSAAIGIRTERIRRSLARCAREAVEIELQPAALHSRPGHMVMNFAYLVANSSRSQFRQRLAALRKQFAPLGFDIELTGPWPPYHFVSLQQKSLQDAAAPDQ